jgi:hypothetical protein
VACGHHGHHRVGCDQVPAKLCEDYGVPVSCTSDRGPNLSAKVVGDMMEDYGFHHRISSVANPRENATTEFGVKTVKRMLMDIVSAKEIQDRAVVSGALLQLRNTLDRELRYFLPRPGSALMGYMNLVDARDSLASTTAQARREEVV